MAERRILEAAISALDAQRGLLGDAVVDAALGPMREQLARLLSPVPGAPPEQALKQVSVLFLDVVGSTSMSQQLDPEDVHAVMDGALQRCTEVVQGLGGKVLQYAGDSLLAAFGAVQTQEDDAERAVRCGLQLLEAGKALREQVRQQHGRDGFGVRVGIHTGPVLLGGGVDDEGTIRGLTVNIAARMEQTAPAGGLRISHDSWLLVRGLFDVEPQPPLSVKGRDAPLVTYLVQRAKPRVFRVPSRGLEGMLAPMVGRGPELARLTAMLDRVAAERRLQMVTIFGDPGLGKSRLLHELQASLETRPEPGWLLLGRAHPQSRLQPYALLRDLLAWRLQIGDGEPADAAKAKLEAGLVPWLTEPAQAKAHRIGQLVGLDFADSPHVRGLEPQLLRTLGFAALHGYLRGLTAGGTPLTVLLEDLQWADDGSLDFLAQLARDAAEVPMAVVATARPMLQERRPDWARGDPAHQALALVALDGGQGEALARALVQRAGDGVEPLCRLLVERAEGNPFYMEELLRMLLDDGVVLAEGERWHVLPERLRAARIPTTLVGVLQARLDSLPASERHAMELASIVGYVFWDDALASLDPAAPAAMPALRGKSLIRRHDSSAFDDTPEAAFHHHLLQEVTYDTVLKPARRAGHAAAASWLAERVGDRPSEYLAITAEHFDRAGDHATALDYFERAARDAQRRFANLSALGYTERALRSPALTDARRRDCLLDLRSNVADLMGDRDLVEALLNERAAIAESLDDDALRADTRSFRALLASRRGDETAALELARQVLPLAIGSGNVMAATLALGQIAWSLYYQGDADGARRHAQEALDRLRAALRDDSSLAVQSREIQLLTTLAQAENGAGRLDLARALLGEALQGSSRLGLRRTRASIHLQLGCVAIDAGMPTQALAHLEDALVADRDVGSTMMNAAIHFEMARAAFEKGQPEPCLEMLQALELEAEVCGQQGLLPKDLLIRGHLAADRGDAAGALSAYEQALQAFESIGETRFACVARARVAHQLMALGQPVRALELIERVATELPPVSSAGLPETLIEANWLCHRVWAAHGDPRAVPALETAHAALQDLASRCGDAAMRRSMLENVRLYREIVAAWHASARPRAGLDPDP